MHFNTLSLISYITQRVKQYLVFLDVFYCLILYNDIIINKWRRYQ